MKDPVKYIRVPDKDNLKYIVVRINLGSPCEVFSPMIQELKLRKYESRRCIIFCRRMADIRSIYCHFHQTLSKEFNDFTDRPYAMFHAQTSQVSKAHIINSFLTLMQALRHQKNRGGLKKFCCKDGTTSSCKVSKTELGFGGRSETPPVSGRKSF